MQKLRCRLDKYVCRGQQGEVERMHPLPGKRISRSGDFGWIGTASMMPSNIERIYSFYKERKCARKILVVFVTLSNLKETSNRIAVNHTSLIKRMKTNVFYYKSDMFY